MIIMEENENSKDKKKEQTVEEIAEIMAENMKANMRNPNFLKEKEERLQKAANEVIKKRKERETTKA